MWLFICRQYGQLMSDKKHVSIGFFGYPNVGKSSIINFLKSKQVCKAAPIPGQVGLSHFLLSFRVLNRFLIELEVGLYVFFLIFASVHANASDARVAVRGSNLKVVFN